VLKIIKKIFAAIKIYPEKKKRLTLPLVGMVISNLVSLLIPLFVMIVMDNLKGNKKMDLPSLLLIMLGWLASIILVSFFEYYIRITFKKFDIEVLSKFHSNLVKNKSQLSFKDWVEQNSKEIADEIKKDLEDINLLLPGSVFPLFRNVILICITFFIMIFINWQSTIAVMLLIPIFLITYKLWDNETKNLYRLLRSSSEKFLSGLIEFLQTIPMMRIFSSVEHEVKKIEDSFSNYLDKNFNYFKIINKRSTYSSIVSSFAPIYLAFCAFFFIYFDLATIGETFAFWGIFSMNINSIKSVSSAYINLLSSIIIFDKFELLLQNEKEENPNKSYISRIDSIKIRNLEFEYAGNKYSKVLFPNFDITHGEVIHIIGESGIGKTTLIKLLLGLMQPSSGEIIVNNKKIDEIDNQRYLILIGYVEQNGYIYSRSLKDNILLGRKFIKENWNKTIKLARLENFISSTKQKENTLLGENGLQISGGERQRILIARAIYHDPQWLFLDEPFTGIDYENQVEINKILNTLKNEKTIIIISHQNEGDLSITKKIELKKNINEIVN